jgi:succinate dehydrogenase/fumarate reductase iron-sulfur protein
LRENIREKLERTALNTVEKNVEFKILRYDPQKRSHYISRYIVPVRKGTTILDALRYIKDNLDPTLTFRYSCRMGICGSCGVRVNGKPMIACYTQVLDLNADTLTIEPLANMPVIKDLIVDIEPFFNSFKKIRMSLIKPEKDLEKDKEFIQMPTELKKYWDLTLCTKCSICYSTCPCVPDERFLGPSALTANYRYIIDSRDEGLNERLKPIIGNIWLCTSCNSCTLVCPKQIDASTAIVENRSLIVERGYIPRTVTDVLTNVMRYHNPIGRYPTKRMEWAEGPNIKAYPNVTKADILYFVCCLTAYDVRHQKIAKALVAIFNRLGVDFANLGNEEWCCGDHILRLGEKGLFEQLAEHNLSMFKKFEENKIVTISPHCYNTFKNDKPYADANLYVQHYTQYLAEAIEKGQLNPSKPLRKRVAYHDPCFLGKRNLIFEEPRKILESIKGVEVVEMKRNKENSFCCGGGAGRVWTEDAPPRKRPSVERVKEALELGVEVIATACPFCVSTLEDAVKVLDVEEKIAIRDIVELLRDAI